jgi:ankyrin repeat protein
MATRDNATSINIKRRVKLVLFLSTGVLLPLVYWIWIRGRTESRIRENNNLFAAIRSRDISGVIQALKGGADPNARELVGKDEGSLIERTISMVIPTLSKSKQQGSTALDMACGVAPLDVVEELLTNGADPNLPSFGGFNPLITACSNGRIDVAELLLKHGAQVNKPNSKGHTPLMAAAYYGKENVVRFLLERKANPLQRTIDNWTARQFAAQEHHQAIVQLLDSAATEPGLH